MADMDNDPQQDLSGGQAIEQLREIVMDANSCMLVTQLDKFPFDARPMAAQAVEADGTIWMISASDSDKNRDLERDPRFTLLVQNIRKYEFAQVSGRATIHRDRALVDKYWSAVANAWFDGKDDPRVTLLALHPETGRYWATRNGKIVTSVRMLLSAAGAKVDEGGVYGQLRL